MTKNELRGYIFKHMEEQGLNYTSVGKMMELTRSAVQSAMTNDSVTYDKLFSICDHIGLEWVLFVGTDLEGSTQLTKSLHP